MERKDELTLLGSKTEYRQDYAPEVLESFVNKHPGNDYWVRFNCPEFTSLCPITGQPDFAEIRISYLPDVKMVESAAGAAAAGPGIYGPLRPGGDRRVSGEKRPVPVSLFPAADGGLCHCGGHGRGAGPVGLFPGGL